MVGMCAHMGELKPRGKTGQLQLMQQFVKYVGDNDLDNTFHREWLCVRPVLDKAMVWGLGVFKTDGLGTDEYVEQWESSS